MEFVEAVVDQVLRDPLGPRFSVPRLVDDPPAELQSALEQQLGLVDDASVAAIMDDAEFKFHHERTQRGGDAEQARAWLLAEALAREVPARRLRELQRSPPKLAEHPALRGVECDDEGLFPLNVFEPHFGYLQRDGFVFTLAPPVQSCNSSYWLCYALGSLGPWEAARVRLDPYLYGPIGQFPLIQYRMWWWGAQLSWDELRYRASDEFGSWWPGRLTLSVQHTQYAWSNRDGEGHLELEELQAADSIRERGSRYVHAIYDRTRDLVVHLDGAIRILTDTEWETRKDQHVKDSGKIGTRLKMFRVDGGVSSEALSALCANYFMWNYDVARFFGADFNPSF